MTLSELYRNTLLRFLFVGGSMSLLYSVLTAFSTLHVPLPGPLVAGLVWVMCIPLAFWCQRRFTFRADTPHRNALWLYAATQCLGITIVALASALLARGSFWPDVIVYLGASALAAMASYLINRLVIFPTGDVPDGGK
ncbi:GtrA family protein [Tabrizicola sp.]|uniref:GtrA family protein n=1 Tax=Tabrizicola sp. TaxID=2005166 RepID=UPI003F3A8A06